jgi:hypothetical protein
MTQAEALQKLAESEDHEDLFFYDEEIRKALFNSDAALADRVANIRYHGLLAGKSQRDLYLNTFPKLLTDG